MFRTTLSTSPPSPSEHMSSNSSMNAARSGFLLPCNTTRSSSSNSTVTTNSASTTTSSFKMVYSPNEPSGKHTLDFWGFFSPMTALAHELDNGLKVAHLSPTLKTPRRCLLNDLEKTSPISLDIASTENQQPVLYQSTHNLDDVSTSNITSATNHTATNTANTSVETTKSFNGQNKILDFTCCFEPSNTGSNTNISISPKSSTDTSPVTSPMNISPAPRPRCNLIIAKTPMDNCGVSGVKTGVSGGGFNKSFVVPKLPKLKKDRVIKGPNNGLSHWHSRSNFLSSSSTRPIHKTFSRSQTTDDFGGSTKNKVFANFPILNPTIKSTMSRKKPLVDEDGEAMRIDSTGFHRSLSCNDFFQPGPNKMRRVNQFTRVGEVMGCFPEERGGGFPSFGSGSVKRISASTLSNIITSPFDKTHIIDCRSPNHHSISRIQKSINIHTIQELDSFATSIEKESNIVFICGDSMGESVGMAEYLKNGGKCIGQLYILDGGFIGFEGFFRNLVLYA